jgi:pimeloyl-ACP methyl ester carboxylesterase
MPKTVADQFVENFVTAGVKRVYGIPPQPAVPQEQASSYVAAGIVVPQVDTAIGRNRSVALRSALRLLGEAERALRINKDEAHACIAKAAALLQAESDLSEAGVSALRVEEIRTVIADADLGANPFVIGHSFGGLVTMKYAFEHGGQLGGAVLVDPPIRSPEEELARPLTPPQPRIYDTFEPVMGWPGRAPAPHARKLWGLPQAAGQARHAAGGNDTWLLAQSSGRVSLRRSASKNMALSATWFVLCALFGFVYYLAMVILC